MLELDQAATRNTFHFLRFFSPSGVSDRLFQRPDGAGRPALLAAQHQSLLWGCLWLLWLHVLQPWTGAQLCRVSVSSNSKCVPSLNAAPRQKWMVLIKIPGYFWYGTMTETPLDGINIMEGCEKDSLYSLELIIPDSLLNKAKSQKRRL